MELTLKFVEIGLAAMNEDGIWTEGALAKALPLAGVTDEFRVNTLIVSTVLCVFVEDATTDTLLPLKKRDDAINDIVSPKMWLVGSGCKDCFVTAARVLCKDDVTFVVEKKPGMCKVWVTGTPSLDDDITPAVEFWIGTVSLFSIDEGKTVNEVMLNIKLDVK